MSPSDGSYAIIDYKKVPAYARAVKPGLLGRPARSEAALFPVIASAASHGLA
jgi:hypothetical protein